MSESKEKEEAQGGEEKPEEDEGAQEEEATGPQEAEPQRRGLTSERKRRLARTAATPSQRQIKREKERARRSVRRKTPVAKWWPLLALAVVVVAVVLSVKLFRGRLPARPGEMKGRFVSPEFRFTMGTEQLWRESPYHYLTGGESYAPYQPAHEEAPAGWKRVVSLQRVQSEVAEVTFRRAILALYGTTRVAEVQKQAQAEPGVKEVTGYLDHLGDRQDFDDGATRYQVELEPMKGKNTVRVVRMYILGPDRAVLAEGVGEEKPPDGSHSTWEEYGKQMKRMINSLRLMSK